MGDVDELPVKPFSLKTLMPGWQYFSMAYPKDYDAYDPVNFPIPKNLFLSSYKRLGVDEATWLTDSKAGQQFVVQSVKEKSNKTLNRPLINILTYHTTEGEQREKYASQIGVTDISDDDQKTDYTTSMQEAYISHMPVPNKIIQKCCYDPETKFRKIITDSLNIRRPGLGKFYDENMDYMEAKRRPLDPPPFKINLV